MSQLSNLSSNDLLHRIVYNLALLQMADWSTNPFYQGVWACVCWDIEDWVNEQRREEYNQ